MAVLTEDAHVKTCARLLVDRLANPFHYADMNDDTVDWAKVYDAMREAQADEGHISNVMIAGLIALSGYDPWGGDRKPKPNNHSEEG